MDEIVDEREAEPTNYLRGNNGEDFVSGKSEKIVGTSQSFSAA